jgi:TolA-binding protein
MLFQLTRSAGPEDAGIVNELLADFPDAYPDSPLIPDALFRRARVCLELLNDTATGRELLAAVARDYPEFARGEPFQRYRQRLKAASGSA